MNGRRFDNDEGNGITRGDVDCAVFFREEESAQLARESFYGICPFEASSMGRWSGVEPKGAEVSRQSSLGA